MRFAVTYHFEEMNNSVSTFYRWTLPVLADNAEHAKLQTKLFLSSVLKERYFCIETATEISSSEEFANIAKSEPEIVNDISFCDRNIPY